MKTCGKTRRARNRDTLKAGAFAASSLATASNWAAYRSGTGAGNFRIYYVGSPVFSEHTDAIASRQLSPYLTARHERPYSKLETFEHSA